MKSERCPDGVPKMLSSNTSVTWNEGITYHPAWAHAGACPLASTIVKTIATAHSLTIDRTPRRLYHISLLCVSNAFPSAPTPDQALKADPGFEGLTQRRPRRRTGAGLLQIAER